MKNSTGSTIQHTSDKIDYLPEPDPCVVPKDLTDDQKKAVDNLMFEFERVGADYSTEAVDAAITKCLAELGVPAARIILTAKEEDSADLELNHYFVLEENHDRCIKIHLRGLPNDNYRLFRYLDCEYQ